MAEKFIVKQRTKLLDFLFGSLKDWSKKSVKQRLQGAAVAVNGEVTTKHDFIVNEGDLVAIGVTQKSTSQNKKIHTLEILYQDRDLIAINKPSGLLSVGTVKETQRHALAILRAQLSRKNKPMKLWPVHRLDRETSGILLFATSKEMREAVMAHWRKSEKTYLAVVEGVPKEKSGTINEPLRMDEEAYRMHVGADPKAKHAVTHYELQQSKNNRSLLKVNIETGRQHQIRAHLAWLGHSIVSDERYGSKSKERMGLHAFKLKIFHPKTKKPLQLSIEAPKDFLALLLH